VSWDEDRSSVFALWGTKLKLEVGRLYDSCLATRGFRPGFARLLVVLQVWLNRSHRSHEAVALGRRHFSFSV
jgi:hypothetical protein